MIDNAFFFRFDRSSFRAFYASSTEGNFTKAASLIGATQSGVSQHILKLEAELGTSLFLRSRTGLTLTETGKLLKDYLEKIYLEEENLLQSLNMSIETLKGKVSYAMPGSCLMSPHFGMMLDKKKKNFSDIQLEVQMESSEEVIMKVLKGDVDFGFITKDTDHPSIEKISFCQEKYILFAPSKFKYSGEDIQSLPFISHPDFSSLFELWHKKQFPKKKVPSLSKMNIMGNTNRIPSALSMVSGGLGLTVLPEHCASELLKKKSLKEVKSFKPTEGTIHIIYRKDFTLPKRVKVIINTFLGFYNKEI